MSKRVMFGDIETHSADERWNLPPREFFRLGQYAINDGPVTLTEDYDEFVAEVRKADLVVGHNYHNFDLSALFGAESTEPLEMALAGKVFDTMIHAHLVNPAPWRFEMRSGRVVTDGSKPVNSMIWLGLDNQCFQLGLNGKIGDLKAMAKEHGGFCHIPLDDEEFREYAVQDVEATRELAKRLIAMTPGAISWEYAWREQTVAAIMAQNSRNGFPVDIPTAQDRVEELAVRRKAIMAEIVTKYGFPTEGKSPWASAAGKKAIMDALAEYQITPKTRKDWPKTPTGAPKLGGQDLIALTEGTGAEEFGRAIAELKGQRSLAQLALDSTQLDGKAHPDITMFQRSGRFSYTKPGLSIWTARGPGAVEKRYFTASKGHKLVEMDFSVADARIVAAYSGDANYKLRFAPGADSHELTGRLVFGDEVYDSDPAHYRQVAKALGHAYAYRAGPRKLAATSGQPLEVAEKFVRQMDKAYPLVKRWQERATAEGESGFITNDWGRRMVVDPDRSYTQSPALLGQSGTRELMVDGLIRIARDNLKVVKWLAATIHDAVVWNIPEEDLEWGTAFILERMQASFRPKTPVGQEIEFPMGSGQPADEWYSASHG